MIARSASAHRSRRRHRRCRPGAGLADALRRGGIRCAEITLRTAAAVRRDRRRRAAIGDFLVGAGTVLTPDDVDRVVDAGARFVVIARVSTTTSSRAARELGVDVIPGVATATEVQRALRLGLVAAEVLPGRTARRPRRDRARLARTLPRRALPAERRGRPRRTPPSTWPRRGVRGERQLDGDARADRGGRLRRDRAAEPRVPSGWSRHRPRGC